MSAEDRPRHGDLTEAAGEIVLKALDEILEEVADADLSRDQMRAIGATLKRAVIDGVRLGAAEISAQAIEQGLNVELRLTITGDD